MGRTGYLPGEDHDGNPDHYTGQDAGPGPDQSVGEEMLGVLGMVLLGFVALLAWMMGNFWALVGTIKVA